MPELRIVRFSSLLDDSPEAMYRVSRVFGWHRGDAGSLTPSEQADRL